MSSAAAAARLASRLMPCLVLSAACLANGAATNGGAAGDFFYHAQPRDTLIGIGRRLLLDPRRWHDVQTRNHIANPRRIPPDSILRIPYDWLRLSVQTATVVAVAGTVQQGGKKVAVGDLLSPGATIETGPDGSVTLDLADGSVVTLQNSSTLKLDEMLRVTGAAAHSIRLKLDSGRIEAKVKPHRDVGRFEIVTPVAVSAVRGTEFRDGFAGADQHATTETLEGAVAVSGGEDSVAVGAGFGTRVEKDKPPLKPVLLLPPPALSQVQAVNSTAALRIAFPPVPGARQYRAQLSADEGFHALSADVLAGDGSISISDVADGNYWLRVRSIDALGIEGADAVRQIIQHVLPESPLPTSPLTGAKVNGTHIHLAWTSPGRAASYKLEVSDKPSFETTAAALSQLPAPAADVDLAAGRYYWRAAALNAQGEAGPWSEAQVVTLRPQMPMPDAPRLERQRLLFSWQAVPGETYRMQISRKSSFETTIRDERTAAAGWSMPKLFPGTYYVRVQSIDADGDAGSFSAGRRFEVRIPLWVKITGPLVLGLAFLL